MKKNIVFRLFAICFLLFYSVPSNSDTIIVRPPEDVFARASLIVEGHVQSISFSTLPSSRRYANITLIVTDILKGSCPSTIIVRRYEISDTDEYLYPDIIPTFTVGDQIIVALKRHRTEKVYKRLGLYNGTFQVSDGRIRDTNILSGEFKVWIRELLEGKREVLPTEFPRFKMEVMGTSAERRPTSSFGKTMDDGTHLNGDFKTYDYTWDRSDLSVRYYYNHDNIPVGVSSSTVLSRINDAFDVWSDLDLVALTFDEITSSHLTSSEGEDNDTSVIWWSDDLEYGYAATADLYPRTGYGDVTSVDIAFTTDLDTWYFGASPPATRNIYEIDFADVLVHELGHTNCLDHADNQGNRMKGGAYPTITITPLRTLSGGDIAGAIHQHPTTDICGTISHAIVLSSHDVSSYNITDNLTVPYLKLESGISSLNISASKNITVNGSLITPDGLTFQKSGGSRWGGIYVNNGSVDFDDVTVEGSYYGITIYDSYPVNIWYSEITDNYYGNVKFDDVSTASIAYSTITNSGGAGYGIDCDNYSTPSIKSYNDIKDHMVGVSADNTSLPYLGQGGDQGLNDFYDNWDYDIYSDNSNTLYAEYNWWGSSSPSPSVTEDVYWEPYLTSDPTKAVVAANAHGQRKSNVEKDTVGTADFREAYLTYLQGNYSSALSLFQELMNKHPESSSGKQALGFTLQSLLRLNRGNESFAVLDATANIHSGKEIAGLAKSFAVGRHIRAGQYQEAIDKSVYILEHYEDSDIHKYALLDLGNIYWHHLNDHKIGESYYRQLVAQYPKDDLTNWALITLGEWEPKEIPILEPQQAQEDDEDVPEEFMVMQNFPNPFNPSTEILYAIPEPGNVIVHIFNILGEEVFAISRDVKEAGRYVVTWDGRNTSGMPVASGLYIYKVSFSPTETSSQIVSLSGKMRLLR